MQALDLLRNQKPERETRQTRQQLQEWAKAGLLRPKESAARRTRWFMRRLPRTAAP